MVLLVAGILAIVSSCFTLSSCASYGAFPTRPAESHTGVLSTNTSSVNFGSMVVGTSTTQSVSITNTGAATTDISSITVSGEGFSLVGSDAAVSLPAGQTAVFVVKFAPHGKGQANGALTFGSNASNSNVTLPLSGTGTQGALSANPSALNFGNVGVGQNSSSAVILTNTGNASVSITGSAISGAGFRMSNLAAQTLNPGQTASFGVTFTPPNTTAQSGSVSISDSEGAPLTIALNGTGVEGGLSANPSSVGFGSVTVGQNSSSTVTLTNSGTASVAITASSISGAGFTMSALAAQTLSPGQTTSFSVTFTPTNGNQATGSVSIASNASGSPLTISLSGTGAQGGLSASPSSVSFGNIDVGQTSSTTITLKNSGTASVSISSSSLTGSSFSMSTLAAQTLGAGQTTSFSVTFKPTSAVSATGSVSIASNAPGSPLAISLNGTGAQAEIAATPASVSFGTATVGSSNSQSIQLTNSGNATLTISQVSVSGSGMSQTGLSTPVTIPAGGSTSFDAVFAPTSANAASGSITLATNGVPSSLTISLSGTGAASNISLGATPTSLSFGSVTDDSSSSLPVTLTNNGNSNITISGVTTTGAGFSTSGVSSGTTLTPGQTATLTVKFDPTSGGAVSGANVTITSNAANSPTTIALSGSGAHSVGLSWSLSSTSGSQYNVYRGTASGAEAASPINSSAISGTTFTDTNVVSGQTYYYVIRAVDSSGSSGNSNEVSATIPTP